MVIDEAQKIKNHGAQVSRAVKEVGNAIGHTRIALSGGSLVGLGGEEHGWLRRWRYFVFGPCISVDVYIYIKWYFKTGKRLNNTPPQKKIGSI